MPAIKQVNPRKKADRRCMAVCSTPQFCTAYLGVLLPNRVLPRLSDSRLDHSFTDSQVLYRVHHGVLMSRLSLAGQPF